MKYIVTHLVGSKALTSEFTDGWVDALVLAAIEHGKGLRHYACAGSVTHLVRNGKLVARIDVMKEDAK